MTHMIQVEKNADVFMVISLKNKFRHGGIIMNGYERIKSQYLEHTNKDKHLGEIVRQLMKHQNMNELYLNEEKNLEGMMKLINKRAKEQAVNNVAIVQDDVVFGWAIDYFSNSDEQLGLTAEVKTNVSKSTTTEVKDDKNQLTLEI